MLAKIVLISDRVFFDTSVLLYVVTNDDPRSEVASRLLQNGGVVSTQVLNEFVSVSRKKLRQDWNAVEQDLRDIRSYCEPIMSITIKTHEAALTIAQRYGYTIYDSLMIASAIEGDCSILYAEDMQDGQKIGSLTIRNPF